MVELILGIDEAGKGPVIGPMIVAGILIDKKDERTLRRLDVKDSKKVTPKRREFLENKIKEVSKKINLVVCEPDEIDESRSKGKKLTVFEAEKIAKIINSINDGKEKIKIIIDCPSYGIEKWKDMLKTKLKNLSNLELVIEHKADQNHFVVSAASILAKCERERKMDEIREKYGDEIGSGYSSDPLTIKFVGKFAEKYKDEGIFRKSWVTWQNAYNAMQ